jgi:uncharacterized Zn finger protein/DNA-binding transcriptional regulator YiaG
MEFWGRYVPVAERRAKAQQRMQKLRKQGKDIQPVAIDGRTLARSFWGKGWCHHLESFSDYANRLPRGRTYVRNGSVCHLEVQPGRVEAIVSGSELYQVVIDITALPATSWTAIKSKCAGQIGSMLELLQGTLSEQVMAIVTNQQQGLFPKPGEISLHCSCPDWAVMCKHVAAVLYGVGNRLDTRPELLFVLRHVDAQELITAELAVPDIGAGAAGDVLADDQLGAIFGIDLDTEAGATPALNVRARRSSPATTRVAATNTRQNARVVRGRKPLTSAPSAGRSPKTTPQGTRRRTSTLSMTPTLRSPAKVVTNTPPLIRPTGQSIVRLRQQQGLSVAQFAEQLGVSVASVYRWEATQGPLHLQAGPLHALVAWEQQAKPQRMGSKPAHP